MKSRIRRYRNETGIILSTGPVPDEILERLVNRINHLGQLYKGPVYARESRTIGGRYTEVIVSILRPPEDGDVAFLKSIKKETIKFLMIEVLKK